MLEEKCRICLGNKKTLMCIFKKSQNISYADMMVSIANVTIREDAENSNQICRSCRKSLQEAYEFKLLIERSDAALNENKNFKKIKFSNINDLKVEIEIEFDSKKSNVEEVVKFEDGINELCYSNTTIKKVASAKIDDVCLKPIPVLEFLKTIKEEDNDNFCEELQDYDVDSDGVDLEDDGDYRLPCWLEDTEESKTQYKTRQSKSKKKYSNEPDNNTDDDDYGKGSDYDGDYIPPQELLNSATTKPKRKRVNKPPTKPNDVCIKPVYLRDLQLIYSKPIRKPKDKKKDYNRKMVCPHCGILTTSLKSHILMHTGERQHKCDECDKAFYSLGGLIMHKKSRHAPKNFKCDMCTAAFPMKQSLKSHKVTHQKELSHVCDICNKGFKRRNTLQRHRMLHNSANKSVMCDLCNMSFFNQYQLRHHLRIHTGERPYKCEICSQPYSYKHDFNRHCLKKHGVFFKRRSVYVMNEEVLKKERILMKDLMLRVNGVLKDDKPINPFEGPQAALAFEQTIKALEARQIPIDFQF